MQISTSSWDTSANTHWLVDWNESGPVEAGSSFPATAVRRSLRGRVKPGGILAECLVIHLRFAVFRQGGEI